SSPHRIMWTPAGTPTARQPARGGFVPLSLGVLLVGGGSPRTTHPRLSRQWLPARGPHESNPERASPPAGIPRLPSAGRAISVIATLDGDPESAAESPVERLGTIQLVAHTQRGQHHSITVRAQDSPDISGEYCLHADLLAAAEHNTVAAAKAFASAGRATHA